jgi:hypothetical protein
MLGPLAPVVLPDTAMLVLCWLMVAPPAGVPLLMYISESLFRQRSYLPLSWFLRDECLICMAPPPPLVVILFYFPFCK